MTQHSNQINLHTTRAHVFQINTQTRNSWLSKCDSAIPISFVLVQGPGSSSPSNQKLKLVGTTDDGESALDCVISWDTTFNKRSQKFVQWLDLTGMIYGLGFDSEADLTDFCEVFIELRGKALSNNHALVGRNLANTEMTESKTINTSETNGRATSDFNQIDPGRTSVTNSAHYSNTSGYVTNNSLGERIPSDNTTLLEHARNTSRNQNSADAHQVAPSNLSNDAEGATALSTADDDEVQSAHLDHQIREQLKYENERLKQALEESSKSASLWQSELMNLRTNNSKLTQALQESKAHVEEWEKELLSLRDENKELRLRVMTIESMNGESNNEAHKTELQKYKRYIEEIQDELRRKENDLEELQKSMEQMDLKSNIGREGDSKMDVLNNNIGLRQKIDIINAKLEAKTNELLSVQKEFAQIVDQLHH